MKKLGFRSAMLSILEEVAARRRKIWSIVYNDHALVGWTTMLWL
jgi:hypothetical protein